jgi:hypothetical protein
MKFSGGSPPRCGNTPAGPRSGGRAQVEAGGLAAERRLGPVGGNEQPRPDARGAGRVGQGPVAVGERERLHVHALPQGDFGAPPGFVHQQVVEIGPPGDVAGSRFGRGVVPGPERNVQGLPVGGRQLHAPGGEAHGAAGQLVRQRRVNAPQFVYHLAAEGVAAHLVAGEKRLVQQGAGNAPVGQVQSGRYAARPGPYNAHVGLLHEWGREGRKITHLNNKGR